MTVLLAGLNQFFSFRYPSVTLSSYVAVLISLPLGRAWATVRFVAVGCMWNLPVWKIGGSQLARFGTFS